MDITVEVNDAKWPPENELERLWNEHRGAIFTTATTATMGGVTGTVVDTHGDFIEKAAVTLSGSDMYVRAPVM